MKISCSHVVEIVFWITTESFAIGTSYTERVAKVLTPVARSTGVNANAQHLASSTSSLWGPSLPRSGSAMIRDTRDASEKKWEWGGRVSSGEWRTICAMGWWLVGGYGVLVISEWTR
jgi:hypothetical protein